MSLEEIKGTIVDKQGRWKEKTRAMRCACTMVKKLIDCLVTALRSNHQLVVREVCVSIAAMAKERTVCLKRVVGKYLKIC